MKKYILLSLLSYFSFLSSFSQEKQEYKKRNFFYVGPFDLFLNTIQLSYEKKTRNYNTIYLSGGFKLLEKENDRNRIGGNGELQYRINLLYNKEALNTLMNKQNYSTFAYFAPYFQYRYEEITDNYAVSFSEYEKATSIVNAYFVGFGFGFRFTPIQNRFCLNIFAGGGMKFSNVDGDKKYTDFLEVGYTGIAPKIGLQMGIAF